MVNGREATPAYIKPDKFGLPLVVMASVRNSRLLEFENPGTHIPAKNCTVRDLWDMLHVYVAPSQVEFAGECSQRSIMCQHHSCCRRRAFCQTKYSQRLTYLSLQWRQETSLPQ